MCTGDWFQAWVIKASNWDFRSKRYAGCHCFVHILPAFYSKVPPKVDCWREKPKICGECKKVLITGNTLTTRNHQVRFPSLMPPRHGKGAPKKVHSIGPASLPANLSVPLRDGMEKPTTIPTLLAMCWRSSHRGWYQKIDGKDKIPEHENKGFGCFCWCRRTKSVKTIIDLVPDDSLPTVNSKRVHLLLMPQSLKKVSQGGGTWDVHRQLIPSSKHQSQ